ncbi:MFS transporter [Paenibacillus popilliae]|uniref:Permease n=1 Tax=Paenibacillus popilliae ATCC 14706 TaxID=1212764 RepID=M9L9A8_PAEPP|nr:MFS transporter [Paenibacillus popilliae]GAC41967.1 permease [Paenibacillus popilliae ATCC 14706]
MMVDQSNNSTTRKLRSLIRISVIDIFGTAITWTGLPVFAYSLTHSSIYTSALFVTSSLASIISALFSGYYVDRYSWKKVSFTATTINAFILLLLFYFIENNTFGVIFPLMIVSQCLGSFANAGLDLWFNTISNHLERDISSKNIWNMTAKTIGFTMGPILFVWLGAFTLFVDAISFFIASFFILRLSLDVQVKKNPTEGLFRALKSSVSNVFTSHNLRTLFYVACVNGAMIPVLISQSVFILQENFEASSYVISMFWLVGGVGMVFSNYILATTRVFSLSNKMLIMISTLTSSGGFVLMISSTHWITYILGFMFITLGNPIIFNLMRVMVFHEARNEMKGKVSAIINSSVEISTLIFLAFSWSLLDLGTDYFLGSLIVLSLIRLLMFFKILQKLRLQSVDKEN